MATCNQEEEHQNLSHTPLEATTTHIENSLDTPTPNRLLDLPYEIHHAILTLLPWTSLTTLRLVHRHFSTHLLGPATLTALHTTHKTHTLDAERHHLHATLQITNATWTGFTQGWMLSPKSSLWAQLPCYHCLRWRPAATPDMSTSKFSRGMSTGQRDLGMTRAKERVCVECALRAGLYVRGSRVRYQIVCVACGRLGRRVRREPYRSEMAEVEGGLLKGVALRRHWFCDECVDAGDGKVPGSRLEFEHERRWGRYERAMEAGKKYRDEKGRKLRAERGIDRVNSASDGGGGGGGGGGGAGDGVDSSADSDGKCNGYGKDKEDEDEDKAKTKAKTVGSKRVCPVTKQRRMCQCWKAGEDKLPEWVTAIQSEPWIW